MTQSKVRPLRQPEGEEEDVSELLRELKALRDELRSKRDSDQSLSSREVLVEVKDLLQNGGGLVCQYLLMRSGLTYFAEILHGLAAVLMVGGLIYLIS